MIKQKSVEEILEVAKVEDVVQDFVSLKRRGVNMIGLCPFHNEKTPSFTVSPAKNIFKCFGCGQAGGPVQFLMEHEGLTFPEALRWLADKYGIKLEETEQNQEEIAARQHKDSLYIINEFAKEIEKFQAKNLQTVHLQSIIMFADYCQMTRLHHIMSKVLAKRICSQLDICV